MSPIRRKLLVRSLRWAALIVFASPALRAAEVPAADGLYAIIETNKGPIVCEIFFQAAPLTAMNFVGLAEGTIGNSFRQPGEPYFDGLTFHRVVKDFVIQGGDPKGDGNGDPGYAFQDEFVPRLRHDRAGTLSMANDGANTNGSQFFITLRETNRLNYLHSVFGRVVSGQDVVEAIAQGDKINHVKIVRTGVAAKAFQSDVIAFEVYKKRAQLVPPASVPADFKFLIDETGTLPDFRVKNFNLKLANYEKFRRQRIVVRILANAKSGETDLKALARELGAGDEKGALLCYFAAADEWQLLVANKLFPALGGGPITDEATFRKDVWPAIEQALLSRARELSKEKKLKEAVDAAIDTLILRLDDFPPSPK